MHENMTKNRNNKAKTITKCEHSASFVELMKWEYGWNKKEGLWELRISKKGVFGS